MPVLCALWENGSSYHQCPHPIMEASIQIVLSKIQEFAKLAKLSKTNGGKLQTHNLWDRNKSSFLPMDSTVKSELANTTWNLTGLAHKDLINNII